MSYNIVKEDLPRFIEGIDFIQSKYPYYIKDKLLDEYNNIEYSVQMIIRSISGLIDISEIFKLIIFDALIGNSDRHHSNWGLQPKFEENIPNILNHYLGLCPLYDNGSSLCSYVNEDEIDLILKDNMRFEALINTKSKSAIGWNDIRPIKHFKLIKELKDNYYNSSIRYVEIIKIKLTDDNIKMLLNKFNDNIISSNMKKLLNKYIVERRNRILEIYEMKEEVKNNE